MSVSNDGQKPTRKKREKRGSVDNQKRLAAFAVSSKTKGADWGACSPGTMQEVVVLITELGGAVTFGMSRDRGAHSITLMLDGDRQTLWYNGAADLDVELESVVGILEASS